MSKQHRLIITADDYGMSPGVNKAIEEGIAFGVLTSTNVMTNMDFCDAARQLRTNNPNISIGIHWCITCGKPVCKADNIKSLVKDDGEFYPYAEFRKRYRKGLIHNEDILTELQAQYDKFIELCGEPDYWNTHENSHVDFKIYQLFVDFASRLGIKAMRSHQRLYVPAKDGVNKQPIVWRMIEPLKHRLITSWQENAHKKGIASHQGLVVAMDDEDHHDCTYLFRRIKWCNKSIAEYVVHPSCAKDSKYMGAMVDSRLTEYAIVTAEKTKKAISDNNITLATYSDL